MMNHDDTNGFEDMSNQEILRILLEEMSLVRGELKEDIAALDQKIDRVDRKLSKKIDAVEEKLSKQINMVSLKSDRNHTTFIRQLNDLDKRVTVLEAAA